MTKTKRLMFLLLSLLFFCTTASAETITLSNGKSLQGTIVSYTKKDFTFLVNGKDYRIKYRLVDSIERSPDDRTENKAIDGVLDKIEAIAERKRARNAELRSRIKNKKVEFYMTSWCPYCKRMEEFFIANDIRYKTYNVEIDSRARQRMKAMGAKGVPVVKIDNRVVFGYNTKAIWSALIE